MARVLVVGGGFAGAAAATALAEKGVPVTLLESRGYLGGRVYSIPPSEAFPAPVDNGPHLFMGCYHETLKLLKRLEVPDPFHWLDPLQISWLKPGGNLVSLKCASLPAPFHLALGLLFSNAFGFSEKLSLAKALGAFSREPFKVNPAIRTVGQFLDTTGQGPGVRERFWVPLCNSVMNVPIEVAPIRGLGEVLRRIFFGSRRDSALAVAAKPLNEVAFPQVIPWLEKRGGSVLFHEGVQTFKITGGSFELTTRSGQTLTGDALVWAIPPANLAALWPAGAWNRSWEWERLDKSPIISVHVILSQAVTSRHFVGLSGAKFEWVFNRNANWGWQGEGQYLSFTASAAGSLARLKDPELVELAMKELVERYPRAGDAQVLHSKVTREMAATFRWTLETDALRPPCETSLPGVFLAGDWTDTGLPATIEGACLSGHRAAEKVRESLEKNFR